MTEVVHFPDGRQQPPEDRPRGDQRISLTFAGTAVGLSVLCAVLTGGFLMGQATVKIESLAETVREGHSKTQKQIDALVVNTNSVAIQASSLAAQIDHLRQALQQERAERLDDIRHYFGTGTREMRR